MAWRVNVDPLRPAEAIEWFRKKVTIRAEEFRQLTDRARRRAFTVAGITSLNLLEDVYKSLLDALEMGTPYEEWAKNLGPKLEAAWGFTNSYRTRLVFQQNILSAYAAGRYAQATQPEVIKARPYWMFDAVLDSATTETCRQLNGTVLRYDHPFWDKNYPPRHFGCRSGVRSLTTEEAARKISSIAPTAESDPGFGQRPDLTEWGRDWAKGVATAADSARWQPVFIGEAPNWRTYGRPAEIPYDTLTVPLLPTIAAVGEGAFLEALKESWGGLEAVVADPTGAGTILNAQILLDHLDRNKPDGRERFFSLLPDVVANPFEVWLVPLQSDRGAFAFRKYFVKLYQDDKTERAFLLVLEQQKGAGWTSYTQVYSSRPKYIRDRRIGFLLWGRD
ncbi:PBECR2 nuclease fold domain-containing protein [Meiothermus taiwanensis]|jgi:SPP1 gp7 family putative phage head morphogenesis protein|uniref:PBECR2 nuclease fold domain-containing protein n=1 Tax=Meiothermus taiwanensis TaxID=172827 RepID=UPI000687E105|nr:MAG: virion morphogenesis protein [Meiothermus sp.]